MISYLIKKIKSIHESLISDPIITESNISSKSIILELSSENYFKILYASAFYFVWTSVGLIINLLNPIHLANKKYIKEIIERNQIQSIEKEIKFSKNLIENNNIVKKNPFMKEIIEKSEKIIKNDKDIYNNLIRYISGFCWFNAKLSHGFKITDDEVNVINSINLIVEEVEPLSYPITLFHGFETYTNYPHCKIDSIINLKGFVSKTISFKIAYQFAYSQNNSNPKFLIINYPIGSKHIHHNTRPYCNEFEFLTKTDENFIVKNIIY